MTDKIELTGFGIAKHRRPKKVSDRFFLKQCAFAKKNIKKPLWMRLVMAENGTPCYCNNIARLM